MLSNKKKFFLQNTRLPAKKPFDKYVGMICAFSGPIDVIMSLWEIYNNGGKWIQQHFVHMKVPFSNFENILYEDQLKLENHFDVWMAENRFLVAFARYDAMWRHQEDISKYFGCDIKLPAYKERNAIASPDAKIIKQLEQTYGALRSKINDMPPFYINSEC